MTDEPAGKESPEPGKPVRAARKRRPFLLNQPVMRRVLYALVPVLVVGIYFFGWRVPVLLAAATGAGVLTEWLFASRRGKPVSTACLVTCTLYALSLPPTMPFWQALVGIVAGIMFAKEFFGGFGQNWANPAIVGRAFVYVAFPLEMTGSFVPTFRGWPGGFAQWSFTSLAKVPAWLSQAAGSVTEAVTSATPNLAGKQFAWWTDWKQLFLGNIGGTFPTDAGPQVLGAGSIGEVCAPLIILAGIYLLVTRTADWRLMLSMLAGAMGVNALLLAAGASGTMPLHVTLFGGSLLYGAVFIVTEPVTAPRLKPSRWIYGLFVGATLVLIRWKGQFSGSLSFSILLGNMVGPSIDMAVLAWKARKTPAKAGAEEGR
jgi:Na+-transporting NADH:ubiquinone oxidoreductase subunit B